MIAVQLRTMYVIEERSPVEPKLYFNTFAINVGAEFKMKKMPQLLPNARMAPAIQGTLVTIRKYGGISCKKQNQS